MSPNQPHRPPSAVPESKRSKSEPISLHCLQNCLRSGHARLGIAFTASTTVLAFLAPLPRTQEERQEESTHAQDGPRLRPFHGGALRPHMPRRPLGACVPTCPCVPPAPYFLPSAYMQEGLPNLSGSVLLGSGSMGRVFQPAPCEGESGQAARVLKVSKRILTRPPPHPLAQLVCSNVTWPCLNNSRPDPACIRY